MIAIILTYLTVCGNGYVGYHEHYIAKVSFFENQHIWFSPKASYGYPKPFGLPGFMWCRIASAKFEVVERNRCTKYD